MKNRTADEPLMGFTQAAISYAEWLDAGDSRRANKAYKEAAAAFDALGAQGAQDRLLELLEFAHPAVRYMAAAFAMRFAPERGEPVLQSMADGPPGSLRAAAAGSLRLRRWRAKNAAA